ncbi:MAG TPA: phosphoglycerate mutase family protein [Blastocatellia bacterium]|nr:phosphoglycerate mutase family protein [Blastocatellia bacterium]
MNFYPAGSQRPRVSVVRVMLLRSLLLLSIPALGVIQAGGASAGEDFKVTTVFLVRHAEKDTVPPGNPPLSEAGRRRAEALARTLKDSGVKAIFTSHLLRTQQTAEPIGKLLKLTPAPIQLRVDPQEPKRVSNDSIREIVDKVHAHAGGAVLVVGHSDTVPEVIRMLGGDEVPSIDERQFDDLFVVTVYEKGKARVARLKYGPND